MTALDFTIEELQSEEWRRVPSFPDYEASNIGRVRSYRKHAKPMILKPWVKRGYKIVQLRADGLRLKRGIHQLVLEAFVGPCPTGLEGCHHDGIKLNNRLGNLRWDTHKENVGDQRRHGTLKLLQGRHSDGQRRGQKLTPQIVKEIRSKWAPYQYPMPRLAKEYGVCLSMIQKIIERRAWDGID